MSMFATASFDPARSSTDRAHQRRDSTNRPQSLSELIEHIRQQRDSDPERAKEADRAVVTDDTDDGLDGLGQHGLEVSAWVTSDSDGACDVPHRIVPSAVLPTAGHLLWARTP